jgi:hypothetical protein
MKSRSGVLWSNKLQSNKLGRGRQGHSLDCSDISRIGPLLDFADQEFLEIANKNGPLSGPVRPDQREASLGLDAIAGIREQLEGIL